MSEYVIETKNLTKRYGTQKSVAELNIHVQKGFPVISFPRSHCWLTI